MLSSLLPKAVAGVKGFGSAKRGRMAGSGTSESMHQLPADPHGELEAERRAHADARGQLDAVHRVQAVIEFDLDGLIVSANALFLTAMGYSLGEIQGRHHRLFVDRAYAATPEYAEWWQRLRSGTPMHGEFKRVAHGGRAVWIHALYSPIHDAEGRVAKIVKFATDITEQRALLGAVSHGAGALSAAAQQLTATSQSLSAAAAQTSAQSQLVSEASLGISHNIDTVATGSAEMATGIREIARNAAEASVIARQGVSVALETNQTVAKLGTSSAEVGEVVDVISSIAAHTNLLALNAAIEAARAGESGKGFAVVANEVKELSRETARATAEISRKIAAIQQDTAGAVDAIHRISEIINQIAHIQTVIASAVEEHTATSNEMSRNVREAAEGSAEISQNIAGVAEAATSTSLGARECLDAAAELTRMAKALQAQVASLRI